MNKPGRIIGPARPAEGVDLGMVRHAGLLAVVLVGIAGCAREPEPARFTPADPAAVSAAPASRADQPGGGSAPPRNIQTH